MFIKFKFSPKQGIVVYLHLMMRYLTFCYVSDYITPAEDLKIMDTIDYCEIIETKFVFIFGYFVVSMFIKFKFFPKTRCCGVSSFYDALMPLEQS